MTAKRRLRLGHYRLIGPGLGLPEMKTSRGELHRDFLINRIISAIFDVYARGDGF